MYMTMERKWWHNSVIYQIYPRSFKDTNGDGIGDLKGIIDKLDYLKFLGIDIIWLCPVCQSPNDDNGYDISDYLQIANEFGTMEDMDTLFVESAKRGIKIMMDMVFNHTSDEHPWFIDAKTDINSQYREYYIWRDPVNGAEPNSLGSVFSGSAWEYEENTKQYYLHLFSKKQPDLNIENPKVREEISHIINFWMEKGVGGFRFDMIELLGKVPDSMIKENGPRLHEYIEELHNKSFGNKDLVTVGECWTATVERANLYANPERNELSMVFQFEHMMLDEEEGKGKWYTKPLDFMKLKEVLSKWQTQFTTGFNSLFWNNHDLPRIVSRFGNDTNYRVESAKMLATLLHGMRGIPYIYQGEELGMTNTRFVSIDEYRDIETLNMYKERLAEGEKEAVIMDAIYKKGRDNARTPMQWDGSEHAGFTTGQPWILVNPNYKTIHAKAALEDPSSCFYHYQALIRLRKELPCIVYGEYHLLLEEHEKVFAYERKDEKDHIVVVCNFYQDWQAICLGQLGPGKEATILLSNYSDSTTDIYNMTLRPFEAIMFRVTE